MTRTTAETAGRESILRFAVIRRLALEYRVPQICFWIRRFYPINSLTAAITRLVDTFISRMEM
jgi:hypothetical protein